MWTLSYPLLFIPSCSVVWKYSIRNNRLYRKPLFGSRYEVTKQSHSILTKAISTCPPKRTWGFQWLWKREENPKTTEHQRYCLRWTWPIVKVIIRKCILSAVICTLFMCLLCPFGSLRNNVSLPYSRMVSLATYSSSVPVSNPLWIRVRLVATWMVGVLGFLFLFLYMIQDYLIYKPCKELRGNPEDFGLSFYDNVSLKTKDGQTIHGWLMKQHDDYENAPTMIYFHGADKNHSFRLVKAFGYYVTMRCNILLMSYRGFGPNEGQPTETGLCLDAEAMMEYLLHNRKDLCRSFFLYGESLGGAVAIYLAEKFQNDLNGLIIENTFTSLIDMMEMAHPIMATPLKWFSQNKWPSLQRIRKIRIPILFLSGLRDGFVPPKMMKKLYEEANSTSFKKFVSFVHGTHNRTWIMEGYYEAWKEFIDLIFLPKTNVNCQQK
ncbi:hypothetical protein GpartN1_g7743.t1 [Galdieria partita]|uniref:Serine aminopeptidase S33 domain-containing protein n=1 Tax=Galdieria partita TaxID=83374 RepID=A0A9C7UV85_9RHOD|nr:hypothetical protein GpartN1_g7743.t1 [Galdieria partita]